MHNLKAVFVLNKVKFSQSYRKKYFQKEVLSQKTFLVFFTCKVDHELCLLHLAELLGSNTIGYEGTRFLGNPGSHSSYWEEPRNLLSVYFGTSDTWWKMLKKRALRQLDGPTHLLNNSICAISRNA